MSYVITTYGGGELFALVFNGIAALFKEDSTGMVMPFIRVGLMVGSVYVVILMLFQNQLIEGVRWFLWVIVATNLIFLPKTTLFIHDPLANTKHKIDHVPLALGMFASFVSQVGKSVTEQFESQFSLPDYMPYHQTGTVFASALMRQVGQFRIVDPVFKGNMERFVNQCVVYDAMIGHKYTLTDLQNTPDLWGFVSSKASSILGFLYKEGTNPGGIVTCKAGAQKLNAQWSKAIKEAISIYGSRVNERTLTQSTFTSDLLKGAHLLEVAQRTANDATALLKQEMMINALEESSNNKLSELGSTSNYAATKALLQQRSAYAVAGEIAARTLPLFKNVIEALSYALFIFIVVLALLPNGYRILLTYAGILVWTQLWAPLYAVLNLIMTLYGKSETRALAKVFTAQGDPQSGFTLFNSSAIVNANADMCTLAAWLSVSIPFISYGILKQGAGAFVGLAQHLGSAMQSAASGAAAEAVSGNISLGNVSLGTQAYQNTTAFQHNTSPAHSSSNLRALSPSGVEQSTFADGNQAFNDQAMSRLSVQIMGTENTSFAQQQNLSNALSVAQTKSVAATEATESSLQTTTNFLSHVAKDEHMGEDYSKVLNASEAKSLQDFQKYINDIRQETGLDEHRAVEVGVSASLGLSKVCGGVGGNGSFSSKAERLEAIKAADSIAQEKGYSFNIEKVASAAQSFMQGTNNTKGSDLGESALASLNQAKSLREEASFAQNQVDTLSKEISSSQGKSFSVQKELTQEVLNFIAHQPSNPGPHGTSGGQIGYTEARRILEHGGAERDAYLKSFQAQNPQYAIQSLNGRDEQNSLKSQYERQAQDQRSRPSVEAHKLIQTQGVHHRAQEQGLSFENHLPSSNPIKQEVLSQLKESNDRIKTGHKNIEQQGQSLEEAEAHSQEKTLGVTAVKNLITSTGKGVGSIAEDLKPIDPLATYPLLPP